MQAKKYAKILPDSCVAVNLKIDNSEIIVCAFYNPPANGTYRYVSDTFSKLVKLFPKNTPLLKCGDLNFLLANWKSLISRGNDAVPKETLFYKIEFLFWQDRTSDDPKTKHGGVHDAFQENLNEKDISPSPKFFHTVLNNISSSNASFLIACINNPPKSSHYIWNLDTFLQFFRHVTNKQKSSEFNSIIFTGRNYFVGTDCKKNNAFKKSV